MAKKATHSGTCQCCGRVQKLPNGRLSNHGYTVDWGFFNGTCGGSKELPLEQDRTILDTTVKSLLAWASQEEASDRLPAHTRQEYHRSRPGKYVTVTMTFREWFRHAYEQSTLRYCSDRERARRKIREMVAKERERLEAKKAAKIKHVRDYADTLVSLADEVHGKELTPVA